MLTWETFENVNLSYDFYFELAYFFTTFSQLTQQILSIFFLQILGDQNINSVYDSFVSSTDLVGA